MNQSAPTNSPEKDASLESRATEPETILVVDDQPDMRDLVSSVLRWAGHRVITADCAQQAIQLAREHRDIALLITDIDMPAMRGDKLALWFRTIRPDVPVLYMSGNPAHRRRLSPAPFLDKPFSSLDRVLKSVRSLLLESQSFRSAISAAA